MVEQDQLEKSTQDYPLVSVVIPAYNAERFIGQTLESVLAQTYQNFEVLVVDDGCQDSTVAIVRKYMQQDSRIQLLQQPNAGVAAARNLGIEKSQGEFIAPLDADDIWYPENIKRQVQRILSAEQAVGLIYSWSIDIDEYGQPTGHTRASQIEGNVYATLLLHDFIANASSVLIRKSSLDRVGGYDVALRQHHGQGGEDWDIYLRIAESYEFRVVPEFLVGYRKVAGSMSTDSAQMARSRHLIWQKIYQRYPHIPPFIEQWSNSSFYLNLATQNYQDSKHKATIKWSLNALKSSPITTLLRPNLYKITVAALLNSCIQRSSLIRSLKSSNTYLIKKNKQLEIKPVKSTWRLKATGERIIHFFASSFLGTANQWL